MSNVVPSFSSATSIIIDDSDPDIRYGGNWSVVTDIYAPGSNLIHRAPIFGTLHVLEALNGTLSYDFIGAGVSLFTTTIGYFRNYTVQCIVDGSALETVPEPSNNGPNKPICAASGLAAGIRHTISLHIWVPPVEPPKDFFNGFCLDYILIEPSTSMELEGYNLFIDLALDLPSTDLSSESFVVSSTALQGASGSPEWSFDSNNGFQTSNSGSEFNVMFTGIGLWWYGYYTTAMPWNGFSSPTFAIDGGLPTPFLSGPLITHFRGGVTPSAFSTEDAAQIPYFNISALPNSSHTLTVVHHEVNETAALTLQSLIIQRTSNTTSAPPPDLTTSSALTLPLNPSTSSIPSTNSSQPSAHTGLKSVDTGLVAGGIAGGVISLLIIMSACFLLIRRRRRKKKSPADDTTTVNVHPDPFIIPAETNGAIIDIQRAQASQQPTKNAFLQELEAPPATKWTRNQAVGNTSSEAPLIQSHEGLEPSSSGSSPSIRDTPTSPSPITADSTATPPTSLEDDGMREEDSGLRLDSEYQGSGPAFVRMLPPAYTME